MPDVVVRHRMSPGGFRGGRISGVRELRMWAGGAPSCILIGDTDGKKQVFGGKRGYISIF